MLKLYAQKGKNVLLEGRHGVGKTEIIREVFNNEFGKMEDGKWAYFSASTMDAWVDFIGAPQAVDREDGVKVLSLVKPERFAEGNQIEALFFDELNRAPEKVLNALMELMQFKSINGKKFDNLKVIWAAVNPHDEEETYSVNKLDPAQRDRFPIQITMPYKLEKKYFLKKYGDTALPFMDWWNGLIIENKYLISPRRLDEAVEIHEFKGDLKHVIPREANVSQLIKLIKESKHKNEWDDLQNKTSEEKKEFFQNIEKIEKYKIKIFDEIEEYINLLSEDYVKSKIDTRDDVWVKNIFKLNKRNKYVKYISKTLGVDDFESFKSNIPLQQGKITLRGKTVAISGAFSESYDNYNNNREGITSLIVSCGGKVLSRITKSVDMLIVKDTKSGSSKIRNARNLGIPVITEKEFHKYYKSAS